ncbi:MAG: translesion error-prone DNA polymerase V autoproteolytic subunit [Bacteroidales bacterium]|nr:translesion error-prone DNA polymerase V autoproteolytic subunit [Bacteroidales bacterium]
MDAEKIEIVPVNNATELSLPFMENTISAGFPSPAEDYLENGIDLNKELIRHPSTTFFGRVKGDSMCGAGIYEDDILVIDKSLDARNDDIAVCFIDGEFTLKRIRKEKDAVLLIPANEKYKPITVTADNDFIIWGIVTSIVRKIRR